MIELMDIPIGIIGTGALGAQLAINLHKAGYRVSVVAAKTRRKALPLAKKINAKIVTDPALALQEAKVIFVLTRDKEIADIYAALAKSGLLTSSHYIGHCSGVLPSKVGPPSFPKNIPRFSIHPMISIPQETSSDGAFQDIWWTFEGSNKARPIIKTFVHKLSGHFREIKAHQKPLYHAACVISSNFVVTLLYLAWLSFSKAGGKQKEKLDPLLSLTKITLDNLSKLSPEKALTGPIVRGDMETVNKHLKALSILPAVKKIYRELSLTTLELSSLRKGVNSPGLESPLLCRRKI